ncbi:MAG TPA: cytochrome c oxidase subunit II [Tepidisphaeraceae bacterium]|nr:cytochrome c oxidase subunit II [Tepidisphaeraceae bacterium]
MSLLSSSEPVQSVLHPASPAAEAIEWLWWLMFWVCTIVSVIVFVLLAVALIRRRRRTASPMPPLGNKFIIISGIILPAIILVGLLIANLRASIALREPETALTVRVIGRQWWWEVHYPELGITTANEIHIPVGRPVRVELRSADVIHSFWVPRLGGKMDMIPGIELTNYVLRASKPGEYRGQCAEFCGLQHALMAFYVVALPPEKFDAWVAERQKPVTPPADQRLLHGRAVFASAACGNCHAIRGTEFTGTLGPDLTHLGSRLTLGAATIPNNRGNLEGWISNPQPLKPGNLMPATYLNADDLHALADYLETLK